MTRAALLPSGSDPYLLAYWLRNYRTWASEVDELHIAVCGPVSEDAEGYISDLCAGVGAKMYRLPRTAHGVVIAHLMAQTSADYVLLCEDDAYIRQPEIVAQSFTALESGEVGIVGTPREGYATSEVLDAASARFGLSVSSFWPCFVFTSRASLLATDGNFGATEWSVGEYIPSLDHTCTEKNDADTFISASWQLRAQGLNVRLHDNHRVTGPFDWANPPWFHVGSLSGGYAWTFMGNMPPAQYASEIVALQTITEDATKRLAWWQRAWDCWDGAMPDHHAAYKDGLKRFATDIGISQDAVSASRRTFDRLVTWAER